MTTVLDSLLASLQKAADYNRDDTVPPAAVLWPDEKREWEKLVPRLRAVLPQFLIFGPYDAAHRSGPAIWLRCVLAGKIADVALPTGTVPIIYLPGVSRATLRATEDCPHELKPLAELQYRGVIWSQANAKDWTVAAYLQTEKGGLQPDGRQGSGHGDLPAPGRGEAGRRPARRPASQVRSRGTERQLFRLAGERRPGGRPALVDVATEGDAEPLGAGPVGNAVQPVHCRLRLRPRS